MATPLLVLVLPARVAVPALVIPNILMDAIQLVRAGRLAETARRMAVLLAFGAVGMVAGTRLLMVLPTRAVTVIIGSLVVVFVVVNAVPRLEVRVPPGWARWLAPPVGVLAGVVGGVANIPGLPLVLYFYSLRMDKAEFVRSVSFTFLVYKLIQLGAVSYFGLLTWPLVGFSLVLSVLSVATFRLGLALQDRLDQATFNRAVLGFLGLLGAWLTWRALS